MKLKPHEHDQQCIQQYFNYMQANPLPDYPDRETARSFPMVGVGGLANWLRR